MGIVIGIYYIIYYAGQNRGGRRVEWEIPTLLCFSGVSGASFFPSMSNSLQSWTCYCIHHKALDQN